MSTTLLLWQVRTFLERLSTIERLSVLKGAVYSDDGELYTWGKAGPHLGYEIKSTKQTSPRRVEFKERQVKVIQVACGVGHTLGRPRP